MSKRYVTHKQMRQHLQKIKRINESARILGLDIGRKYTGLSISNKQISNCKPLRTLQQNA